MEPMKQQLEDGEPPASTCDHKKMKEKETPHVRTDPQSNLDSDDKPSVKTLAVGSGETVIRITVRLSLSVGSDVATEVRTTVTQGLGAQRQGSCLEKCVPMMLVWACDMCPARVTAKWTQRYQYGSVSRRRLSVLVS